MVNFTTASFGDKRPTKPKPLFSVLRKNNRTATANTDVTTEDQQQTSNNMSQFTMDSPPSPVPLHPLATCSTAGALQPPSSWDAMPISPNHDPYTPPPNSVTLVDKPMKSTRHHHNRYNTVRSTQRVDVQFLGDSQREDAFAARQAALNKLCGKTPSPTVTDFTTDITTIPSPPLSPVQQQPQLHYHTPTRQLTTSSSHRYHKKQQQQQTYSPLLPPPEKYSYSTFGNNSNSSSIDRQQTIRRKPTRRAARHVPTGYFPSPPSPSNINNYLHHHHSNHHNYQQQVGCFAPPSSSPRYLQHQHTQKNKLQPSSRSYRNTPLTPPIMQESTTRRKPTALKSHEEDDNLPLIHTVVTPTSQNTKLSQSEYFSNAATATTTTTTASRIRSHDDESDNAMLDAALRQSFVSEFTDSETDSISTGSTSEEAEEESDDDEDRVVSLTRHMRSIIVNENSNYNNHNITVRPSSPITHQRQY